MWKRLSAELRHNVSPHKVTKLNINNGELSGKELADTFNKHFFNASNTMSNQLAQAEVLSNTTTGRSDDLWKIPSYRSFTFLNPVNKYEVITTIINLSNSTAKYIDGIQMKPIKYVAEFLAPCLTHLFNLCLIHAIFRCKMQVARVIVLHKKGDKNDTNNYRPVSIIPIFLKC